VAPKPELFTVVLLTDWPSRFPLSLDAHDVAP
jgi:hypothetical protein